MRELGRRIKSRRTKLGLSQTELGRRVGRSHGHISNLEHGKTPDPPAELLTALAVELGDEPADYLRLAGRVALTAEDLVPARTGDLPPQLADAIERAVTSALQPLLQRIDLLVDLLEERPGAR